MLDIKSYNISGAFLKKIFFDVYLFLREERERDRVPGGRGRVRGRQRLRSRLHAVSTEPDAGLELMDHEIMT